MTSSRHLLRSLEALPSQLPTSRYICTNCRWQSLPKTRYLISAPSRRHNSSGNLPFTEKVRRKLWGTDNPPGLKDPYGGESILERRARERRENAEGAQKELESQSTPEAVAQAAPAEIIAPLEEEYTPATTWDGLEHVGSLGEWWEQPATEKDVLDAFMRRDKITGNDDLMAILHQVMVELSVMKELNKPFGPLCDILEHAPETLSLINQTEITPSSDNFGAVLAFPNEDAKTKVFEFFREFDPASTEEATAPEGDLSTEVEADLATEPIPQPSATEVSPPVKTELLSVALGASDFKFFYLKRVSQLTGHLIPDHKLSSISSVATVFDYLVRASNPKPTKLADQLLAEGIFDGIPNVKVYNKRQTPIDREIETGQWKVIEQELVKRGLPVTGHAPT